MRTAPLRINDIESLLHATNATEDEFQVCLRNQHVLLPKSGQPRRIYNLKRIKRIVYRIRKDLDSGRWTGYVRRRHPPSSLPLPDGYEKQDVVFDPIGRIWKPAFLSD